MDQPQLPLAYGEGPKQDRTALLLSIHTKTRLELLEHVEGQIAAEAHSGRLLGTARDILRDVHDYSDPEDEVQAFLTHLWAIALDGVMHTDPEVVRQFRVFARVRAEMRRRERRVELAFGHRARRALEVEQLALPLATPKHSSAESGGAGDDR